LCLVLLDLDRFKVVNDTFGHDAGDHVLKTLANICMYNVRDIDIFARLGGDEFVLLLPNADSERAMQIMERIRMKLTANPMLYHENPLNVTMSFGIAPVHQGEDSLDSLLRRADQALYRAKDKGKNRGAHAE
jgi:diguanylate cyclase